MLFSDDPELFLPKHSHSAILYAAHFRRVVNSIPPGLSRKTRLSRVGSKNSERGGGGVLAKYLIRKGCAFASNCSTFSLFMKPGGSLPFTRLGILPRFYCDAVF